MSENENINGPRFTITAKGNGCPGCGFPRVACRCGGGGGGSDAAETDSQESKDDASSTLSIKLELPEALTPQLERDALLSVQTIFTQFKQELKDQGVDVRAYAAAIVGNELQVKTDDLDHLNAFIQRLNNNSPAIQNNSANTEKKDESEIKTKSPSSIPKPFALPTCTPA